MRELKVTVERVRKYIEQFHEKQSKSWPSQGHANDTTGASGWRGVSSALAKYTTMMVHKKPNWLN